MNCVLRIGSRAVWLTVIIADTAPHMKWNYHMTRLQNTLFALVALTSVAATLPAAANAQAMSSPGYERRQSDRALSQVDTQLASLRDRIYSRAQTRQMSPDQADRLIGRLNDVRQMRTAYLHTGIGIDAREYADLNGQLSLIADQLSSSRSNFGHGYGQGAYGQSGYGRW